LRIQAGSMDDPPGKEGLAHLVEHLMFYLRRDPRGPTLDERLRAVTSSYNATTDLDGTYYVAHVAPADADAVAAMFAEIASEATCAHLDRKALEHERAIVRGERRLRVGRASQVVGDALREVAYPAHHPFAPTASAAPPRSTRSPGTTCACPRTTRRPACPRCSAV
jgi:zinc protease